MLIFLIDSPYFSLNFTSFVFYVLVFSRDLDVDLNHADLLVESSEILGEGIEGGQWVIGHSSDIFLTRLL